MCTLKTWTNTWTTTRRLHNPDKGVCVFGCRAQPDDFRHYAFCSPLWNGAGALSPAGPPGDDLLAKLGLVDYYSGDFNLLIAAFHLYNHGRSHVRSHGCPLSGHALLDASRAAWQLVHLSHHRAVDDVDPLVAF